MQVIYDTIWLMNDVTKPKQVYRKITTADLARFKAEVIAQGNSTAAVRKLEPNRLAPHQRAYRIVKKGEAVNTVDYIENVLQQIGVDAVNRLGMLVNSSNESVATKNVHYTIDHIRGQSVRRSESKHLSLSIEAVLDGE